MVTRNKNTFPRGTEFLLTAAEYAKMAAYLDRLKSRSVLWHAALYNCNRFVGAMPIMLD